MPGVYVIDSTGAIKQTGGTTGGGLTSPVGIADGGTGQTSKTPAFDALAPTTTTGDLIYYNGTDNVRLAIGSASQVLTVSGGAPAWATAASTGNDYIHIEEQQTSGTSAGTFTSGAWQTRVLNTEVTDTGSNASLSSNQITLSSGTYRARITCPAYGVGYHQARLQNVTDGTTALDGTSAYTNTSTLQTGYTFVTGQFVIASTKTFEVQHRCGTTRSTNGFGTAASLGTEVYTVVELTKVA